MKIVHDNSWEGMIVRIDVGKRLDLTAYKLFSEAISCAVKNPRIVGIQVDFSGTHRLFDSGKAMLLNLKKRTRHLKIPLRLANISPEIRQKL